MPLSEHEQRLLEEMERSLYQNDADFVSTANPRRGKPNYTILLLGILVAIAGVAIMVTGVIVRQPLVGVLGFALMFVGVLLAVAPPRQSAPADLRQAPSASKRKGGFMDSLNDRWDKRQDGRS